MEDSDSSSGNLKARLLSYTGIRGKWVRVVLDVVEDALDSELVVVIRVEALLELEGSDGLTVTAVFIMDTGSERQRRIFRWLSYCYCELYDSRELKT